MKKKLLGDLQASLRNFGSFRDTVKYYFDPRPVLPGKSFLKLIFDSNENGNGMGVSVSIRLEHQVLSGVQTKGPALISWDNFQRIRWLVS